MRMRVSPRGAVVFAVMAALALVPPVAGLLDEPFYTVLFGRVVIFAIAAVSLNLILGYGGMVSFGHATYVGLGAYTVGIASTHALENGIGWLGSGFVQFPLAVLASALAALLIGAISLRTRGLYFIMITLAFGQMLYFAFVGLERYGADDGLPLPRRSDFAGLLDLGHEPTAYYLGFALLLGTLYLVHRIVNSRFGLVIQGARSNEARMTAMGFHPYPYRLVGFVIAGAMAGLAGALLANHSDFVSPALMHWTRSGDLIIMVLLGGIGRPFGPVLGCVSFLLLEELLSGITEHWQLVFGPFLILVVLFGRGGIDALLERLGRRSG